MATPGIKRANIIVNIIVINKIKELKGRVAKFMTVSLFKVLNEIWFVLASISAPISSHSHNKLSVKKVPILKK